MSDTRNSTLNFDPTDDTSDGYRSVGGVLKELKLNNEEIFERLKKTNDIRRETIKVLEEIPLLIEYLDTLYPFFDFENRLIEFEKRLEEIDNV